MFEKNLAYAGFSLTGNEAEQLQNKGQISIDKRTSKVAAGQNVKLWIDMDRAQVAAKISGVQENSIQLEVDGPVEWNPEYEPYF